MLIGIAHAVPQILKNHDRHYIQNHLPIVIALRPLHIQHTFPHLQPAHLEHPGIKQPEVPHLMNGEFSHFSEGKLLNFLKRLDRKIMIQINAVNEGQHQLEATLTP
jgi:predicted XRE-type DNA-binding protein